MDDLGRVDDSAEDRTGIYEDASAGHQCWAVQEG